MNLKEQIQKKAIWKFYLPSFGVFEREVRRFFAVPAQTIFAPLGSSLIYFALFGLSLGRLIQSHNQQFTHGFSYIIFLIPGIMAMETLNASFQNPITSIMLSRWTGTLVDIITSPVTPIGLWLAYISGALVRAFLVGASVFIAGSICAMQFIHANWLLLFLSIIINVCVFSSFGVIVGSIAKTWEQLGIVTSFVLQPLTFFSGVFFSFNSFPPWLQTIKYFNPIFYMVSMFRIAVLGEADTKPFVAYGVSLLFLLIGFCFSLLFLKKGFGLRN